MADDRTAGEQMFDAYLVEHGHDVPEHEPDLIRQQAAGLRHPARGHAVHLRGQRVRARHLLVAAGRFGTTSAEVILKPIRSQIRERAPTGPRR
jgi:hypothetical protein